MTQIHSIQVIDRMVRLLDILASHDKPLSLKIISAESTLHSSTVYRILAVLIQHRMVEKDENGAYQLGYKLLQLGGRVKSHLDLRREAMPVMQRLRDQIGETVNLAVPAENELIYIERVPGIHTIRAEQVIGSRAPLHVTAVGKMILADRGYDFCRQYAKATGLPAFTSNSISTLDRLISEINQAAQLGYARDDEEAEKGMGCIGVLIRDASGGGVAGLSISAPMERRSDDWFMPLVQAGRQLSSQLGYN